MSDSLRPHGWQHTRLPYPSPTPRVHSNSFPSCRWCHPTISSSVIPFFSCLQSFPASGSFPMSQFFALGGQSIGVSAWASVLPMNIQDWFPLGLTGWISKPKFYIYIELSAMTHKESACNAGDTSLILASGRSPGERNDNPFQYSCLKIPKYRGSWWVIVQRVTKSWKQLNTQTHIYIQILFYYHYKILNMIPCIIH